MKELFNKVNGYFTPANVKKILGYASNTGIELEKAMNTLRIPKVMESKDDFRRLVNAYKEYKELHGYMDFDDILLHFLFKLKNDEDFRLKINRMFQ